MLLLLELLLLLKQHCLELPAVVDAIPRYTIQALFFFDLLFRGFSLNASFQEFHDTSVAFSLLGCRTIRVFFIVRAGSSFCFT